MKKRLFYLALLAASFFGGLRAMEDKKAQKEILKTISEDVICNIILPFLPPKNLFTILLVNKKYNRLAKFALKHCCCITFNITHRLLDDNPEKPIIEINDSKNDFETNGSTFKKEFVEYANNNTYETGINLDQSTVFGTYTAPIALSFEIFKNITVIIIDGIAITKKQLMQINNLKNLKELTLVAAEALPNLSSAPEFDFSKFPKLHSLAICGFTGISQKQLGTINKLDLSKLRKLELNNFKSHIIVKPNIDLSKTKNLTALVIYDVDLTKQQVEEINKLSKLKIIDFGGYINQRDKFDFSNFKKLTSLSLSFDKNNQFSSEQLESISNLKKLKKLELWNPTDNIFDKIDFSKLNTIESLLLEGPINSKHFEKIYKLENLQQIELINIQLRKFYFSSFPKLNKITVHTHSNENNTISRQELDKLNKNVVIDTKTLEEPTSID
jgi:hypothetical protein